MQRLPDWPIELRIVASVALAYLGIAVLMGVAYIVVSHEGAKSGYLIGPDQIAALYTDPGVGLDTLISLAHIHLLGLFPIFAIISFIYLHTTLSMVWRLFWAVLPFIAFLLDVACWFLTKYVAFGFVYGVIAGGFLFILSLGVMILISFFQMWFMPRHASAR
jgi:hypothetical protein